MDRTKMPTLVMVHGLIGSLGYFQPAERVAGGQVLTPDLLGYGGRRDVDGRLLTLTGQADLISEYIERVATPPVWLLGHSMGGAIVMMVAAGRPDLVAGIINVEGNFTQRDAFWSGKIAALSREDWHERFTKMIGDPADWLRRSDISVTEERLRWATVILENQPADTIQAMSHAIVSETESDDYGQMLQQVAASDIPIHLIAGERSASAWDVPTFIRDAARSYRIIPGAGHMMMLEKPDEFCLAVSKVIAN